METFPSFEISKPVVSTHNFFVLTDETKAENIFLGLNLFSLGRLFKAGLA
jgi:hypothetical protein